MTCGMSSLHRLRRAILLVGDMLHPCDVPAVLRLLDRNVRHALMRRRAVPMLVLGRAPQDVAGVEFEDRAAFDLSPADAFGDDQRLAERMGMPSGARAGLEM